jgi:hypothetical protein
MLTWIVAELTVEPGLLWSDVEILTPNVMVLRRRSLRSDLAMRVELPGMRLVTLRKNP